MKRLFFASVMVILLFMLINPVQVTAQPTGSWVSSIYCINQSDVDTAITVYFYENGIEKYSFTDAIGGEKTKYYFPADLASLGSFTGSVVIESSEGLACSVQSSSKATGTQSNPFMYGASSGFALEDASPVIYISQVDKNFDSGAFGFYNSYIAIQNTSDNKVLVEIEYSHRWLGFLPTATREYEIEGKSNILVYLYENTDLPDNFLGSAKISAKDGVTPLVAQTGCYNDSSNYKKAQFTYFNGVSTGESVLYVPYIMRHYYDFNAGITIVNTGKEPTSFNIVFSIGRSKVYTYTYQYPGKLEPDRVVVFFLPDMKVLDPVDKLPVGERAGAAMIYATDVDGKPNPFGQLIANVNHRNDGRWAPTPNFGGAALSYNAVGIQYAGKKLYAPNIQNKVGGALFTSGINVTNTENKEGLCTFYFVDDPSVDWDIKIPPNGIYIILVSNIPGLSVGYNSGAIIECDVDVIAIITNRADASNYWGDSNSGINAIKQ